MSLLTKNVFLTGGAAGLGKAYTELLLNAGARVVFVDVNAEVGKETEKELGEKFGADNVTFIQLDCTKKDDFEEAFKTAVSKLGYVDLMVNNAGIMNESVWEFMILLNYTGVVRGTYIAKEHMRKDKGGKGGRIVNISSLFGLDPHFTTPVYCGTKHAVRAFTQALVIAPDREELGIEYAVLCPGPTETALCTEMDELKIEHFEIIKKGKVELGPVNRVAQAFMNLVTQEKMNGAVYYVDKDEMEFYKVTRSKISWPPSEEEEQPSTE